MSIIYCNKHDLSWDSDKKDECPECETDDGERARECLIAAEDAMRELTGALHLQLLNTGLVTTAQWNAEIAPKLSAVTMAILGVTITARTYRVPEYDQATIKARGYLGTDSTGNVDDADRET